MSYLRGRYAAHEREKRHRDRLLSGVPGIWFDRCELDKIDEHSLNTRESYREEEYYRTGARRDDRDHYDDRRYDKKCCKGHKKRNRSPISMLGDIIEIFGGDRDFISRLLGH